MRSDQKSPHGGAILRTLPSEIRVQVLPENGWEQIAAHEIKRLALAAAGYREQLDRRSGCVEFELLHTARRAVLGDVERTVDLL